jgi:glycosyltransferase involved in cell wall biosynthesis
MNKILILLLYYKRPKIVLNALNSLKNSTYSNWELCFIDDSGDEDFKKTLFNFGLPNEKINYIPIYDSTEIKEKNGGVRIGEYMNKSIRNSNAEIAIMLCDDDALDHRYLENLNSYFITNPNIPHCYSKLMFFNPELETYLDSKKEAYQNNFPSEYNLNRHNTPINPFCKLDASQVAWKTKCNKDGGVWFDELRLMNHDADFYAKLHRVYGNCHPTNFIGQHKGVSENQLGNRVRMKKKPFEL